MFYFPEENLEPPASAETPPPPATANADPVVEAKQEMDNQITTPESAAQSVTSTAATEVPAPLIKDQQSSSPLPPAAASSTPPAEAVDKVDTKVADTVDAPVVPSASLATQEEPVKMEEPQAAPAPAEKAPEKEEKKEEEVKKLEKEEQVDKAKLEPAVEVTATVPPVNPVNIAKEEMAAKTVTEVSQPPPSAQEPTAPQTQSPAPSSASEPEPTPAETAEPLLSNGLPQDTEELSEVMAFSDTTPLDKPDASLSQESTPVAKTVTPAQEEAEETEEEKKEEEKEKSEDAPPTPVSCPTEESTTMQGRVDSSLNCI